MVMGRPKKIIDGERISVFLSKKQVDQIKRRAMQMSLQEKRLIGVCEVIRMSVELSCPVPKQFDLFD